MSAPPARTSAFQALKPVCVALSKAASNLQADNTVTGKEVVTALVNLNNTLSAVARDGNGFDAKLAEYVFFPVSQVFRASQIVSVRALELALRCLKLLLETGWKQINEPNLAVQLLILLSFLLAGKEQSPGKSTKTSEELQEVAFACEGRLFTSIRGSPSCKDALFAPSNVPALGHAITVMLEGAKDGTSIKIQLEALSAFEAFVKWAATREVCASFLPGIVSSFTVILTPSTQSRRSFKVIALTLSILIDVIKMVLSDMYPIAPSNTGDEVGTTPTMNSSWLKATSAQMKLAFANIVKLRQHDRREVRTALQRLCNTVLEDCPERLSESRGLMLETLIVLSMVDRTGGALESASALVNIDADLAELLRESIYTWITSMPRIMASNDDMAKSNLIGRIRESIKLLSGTNIDLTVVNSTLLNHLQDTALNIIAGARNTALVPSKTSNMDLVLANSAAESSTDNQGFELVLTDNKSSQEALLSLQKLSEDVAAHKDSDSMLIDLMSEARNTDGDAKLVSFWLSLSVAKSKAAQESLSDGVINFEDSDGNIGGEELYSQALAIVSQADDDFGQDWRLQALALEALALHSTLLKKDFRVELVDALYPVVHLAGSSNVVLQRHARTCLDIFASTCGYENTKDLLVSNADYLINAVAMKLNAFDISPQAAQVLLMMTRLSGPRLIPYLDDLVSSIFEALESFHGYVALVELLFSVLKVIVEEGTKAPYLAIEAPNTSPKQHGAVGASLGQPMTMSDLISILKDRQKRYKASEDLEDVDDNLPQETPHQPWDELRPGKTDPAEEASDEDGDEATEESKPKLSKTYNTILSITTLTQHHLPSSSPSLRYSLLTLLSTSLPYLAQDQDSFLPIINTLWPVLTARLRDKEAYIVAAILDVMCAMCTGAGDFMRGRIEGIWPVLHRLHNDVEEQLLSYSHSTRNTLRIKPARDSAPTRPLQRDELVNAASSPAAPASNPLSSGTLPERASTQKQASVSTAYTPTTTRTLQSALTKLIATIVQSIPSLPPALFMEAMMTFLAKPLEEGDEWVRSVVRERNEDALWVFLARQRVECLEVGCAPLDAV